MTVNEGAHADQGISATDPDGDAITFTSTGPAFMTVTSNAPVGGTRTGNIHLAPGFQEASCAVPNTIYTATVKATDPGGLSDTKSFTITVVNVNRAPVSNPGGPYTACAGASVTMNGSASSDPDGDPLTFAWDFGDGNTGSGATPTHAYANPGSYVVRLTATDNCTPPLNNSATTNVTVTVCQALISRCPSGPPVNLNSAPDACFYIEPVAGCFNAADVAVGTEVMKYGSGSISTTGVGTLGDACPTNGTQDLKICFTKANLSTLFSSLATGTTTVTVTIEGSTTSGCKFQGAITFDVKK